ncbi:H-type lectin domain-containing protein [Jiangella asiatica]|uniref:H-type lectin domain-containing protein n=1 Tax=Jiangella asiatica TaxID=2530372 RepID=A0A4R5CFL7_9ACTN|nr:H-type lectin domain-containing protein [Jiangella asiatica]TDD98891.1 hypothetical protein E1269_28210 [Jiangella asiatica]
MNTPIYGWPVPTLDDEPDGPDQIDAGFRAIEETVDGIDTRSSGNVALLGQFMSSQIPAAPPASTDETAYPIGLSVSNVSGDNTWPENFGFVVTFRHPTSARTVQQFFKVGSQETAQQWVRHWRAAADVWSDWAETTSPPDAAAGIATVSFTSQTTHTQNVSFGRTFDAPPAVTTEIVSGSGATAQHHSRAISVTTTGFTLFIFNSTGSTTSWSNIPVSWQAMAVS